MKKLSHEAVTRMVHGQLDRRSSKCPICGKSGYRMSGPLYTWVKPGHAVWKHRNFVRGRRPGRVTETTYCEWKPSKERLP